MLNVLSQLGVDQTFWYQFAIFVGLFFILKRLFFQPYLRLFEVRHQRTVEDRKAAERMLQEAEAKLKEYKSLLSSARDEARKEYDGIIKQAKQQETEILTLARDEAKKVTQEALADVEQQRNRLRSELQSDIETIAEQISNKLLVGK